MKIFFLSGMLFLAMCCPGGGAEAESVIAFLDTFERHAESASLAGAIPEIGDSWTREEGAPERQIVRSDGSLSGRALRLERRPGEKQVLRGETDPRTARLQAGGMAVLRAVWRQDEPAQGACLTLTPFGWSGFKPSVWARPGGTYHVWASEGGSEWRGRWIDTGVHPSVGAWETIEISARWDEEQNGRVQGLYEVWITRRPGETGEGTPVRERIAADVPTAAWPAGRWLHVMIENRAFEIADRAAVTWWDRVELEVFPPRPTDSE